MGIEIASSNLLIVEGEEERLFFEALKNYMQLEGIQIIPIGGKDKIHANLKALVKSPRFSNVFSINIVRDANTNPKGAFQSVCAALRGAGLPVPQKALQAVGENPRVCIMILPQEDTPGMLEDICLRAIENDPAYFCAHKYFDCLKDQGMPLPKNSSKALIQVFLASRKEPGKRLGEAAQAGYFPWDNKAFDGIKEFFKMIS
jgi:hypothetical protein